ncbi:MAG: hypothetical protein GY819_04865 [Planctomycetaceae bacterium]|nr:hypothetical protein [Planctomycetaceae bacterium]
MVGRRTIWANDDVIELSKQFVAATDEVWRLQNGDDPECKYFREFAEQGHYRGKGSTRQGTYICTPSGILLGSLNSHNADAVLKMMQAALKKYESLEPKQRLLAAGAKILPDHRWEASYQPDGLDLTMIARDMPESCDPEDSAGAAWNQDRIWFSKAETQELLKGNIGNPQPGDQFDLSPVFVSRLARFSVIDTVRGQTSCFQQDEVAGSQVKATVTAVEDDQVHLQLQGRTVAESSTSRGRSLPHGMLTKLLGTAIYDRQLGRFSSFEMVAIGERQGRTVYNGRHRQADKSNVGFVVRLTPQNAPLIAPTFLFAYDADWVQRPE